MAVGIDRMNFYSPQYALDLVALAQARGDEPDKYTIGIGQSVQAVVPNYEDVVTMGVNAAEGLLTAADRAAIDMVIFATESGIDNSKSGAVYAQRLLGLSANCRTIEMKQACYAGTYGLMQAKDYVTLHPDKKVLVIAADIARYGLATAGEVTQGAGAVAMIVAADPALAVIADDSVYRSEDVADFWRPIDSDTAIVDGHLSTDVYKRFFAEIWQSYKGQSGHALNDFAGFAFHLPYTKMGKKALDQILPEASADQQVRLQEQLVAAQAYSRLVGNLYTGSVYLSLLSLLKEGRQTAGDRLGIFSFGSGAEAELYSLTLVPGYEQALADIDIRTDLAQRRLVTVAEYETYFQSQLFDSSQNQRTQAPLDQPGCYFLGWQAGQRLYQNNQ
ncbi:hydroxymethylglutaryl-CoA synthase [Leuconostocaceae bacterium ESL0958]|nr:hydroxymethylglutaryl-CoA synthase [Leuconostocaceae bacterium ESL0958]